MKRILLASLLVTTGVSLMAQNVERAKNSLNDKKFLLAKEQIDKTLANPKRTKDAEAWYVKSKIYAAIANDSAVRGSVPEAREQAFEALKQYVDLDKKSNNKQFQLIMEQYKPATDIYYGYYSTAAAFYNSNNFKDAFTYFKKCLEIGDYIRSNDWKNAPGIVYSKIIDTNVVLFTGISAEKIGNKDSAAYYYSQLVDKKIKTENIVEVAKWLVDYYNQKQDKENMQKYLALGKEMYPEDSYWTTMELEVASSTGDRTGMYKKYEEMMQKEPANYQHPYNYGVELYREAYTTDADKRPANSKEMIDKATELIRKSLELKPDFLQSSLVMGQILYNRAVGLSEQQRIFKGGLPNAKLSQEEIKQKDDMRTEMFARFDEAIPYLEKVGTTLGSQGKLSGADRKLLKEAYDLLITIYDYKQLAKDLSEDQKKIYKKQMEEYQNKFNNVDKEHI